MNAVAFVNGTSRNGTFDEFAKISMTWWKRGVLPRKIVSYFHLAFEVLKTYPLTIEIYIQHIITVGSFSLWIFTNAYMYLVRSRVSYLALTCSLRSVLYPKLDPIECNGNPFKNRCKILRLILWSLLSSLKNITHLQWSITKPSSTDLFPLTVTNHSAKHRYM